MSSHTAANVLGTIGTILWCIQLIPQIIANYRTKNTEGLPEPMVLLWCASTPFFCIYFVARNAAIPIQIQPHLFGIFCVFLYFQVMYYPPVSRSRKDMILRGGGYMLFWIAVEIASVVPLRRLWMRTHVQWPTLIYGIIASVLLAVGIIPPYRELWKRKGRVVGINFLFLGTDFLGGVLSLASLAAEAKFDVMGGILYIICASLELGIFISHFIWCCRFKWFKKKPEEDVERGEADIGDGSEKSAANTADTETATIDKEASTLEVATTPKSV